MQCRPGSPRAVLALLVLLGGCGFSGPTGVAPMLPAEVEVQNNHWEDLTIFLERDGTLHRLGVAGGNTTRTLSVPAAQLVGDGWVRLVAMETGRDVHAYSEVFCLLRGQSAHWQTGPLDQVSPVFILP